MSALMQQQGSEVAPDFMPRLQKLLYSTLQPESTARCQANYASWPQSAMTTGFEVAPLCDPTFSIALTVSYPSTHVPNTTCLPSRCGVWPVQTKNCEPLVFGPALAIDKQPAPVCFPALPAKDSSANLAP